MVHSTCPDYEPDCTHHACSVGWHEDKGEIWDMEDECLKPQTPCDALSAPGMVGCHSDKSKICTRDEWYCTASDAVQASNPKPVSLARPISNHIRGSPPPPPPGCGSQPGTVFYVQGTMESQRDNHPLYPMFVLVFVSVLVYLLFMAFI